VISGLLSRRGFEVVAARRVVFYERGESRENFSHAGSKEYFFDRQPPFYPSTRQPDSRPLVSRAAAGSES
jgi:hypothetical protein